MYWNRHGILRFVAVTFVIATPSLLSATDTYLAPQFDLYLTHNKHLRSHVVVSGNWLTQKSEFTSAWAQYDIDIGLVSFFRRYLFKDPNVEKSKRISFRLGYLQVSDLKSDPNGFDEKRPLAEVTFRVPVGQAWLIEDRNREEFRHINGIDWARYRNRIRVERNVAIKNFRLTPYGTTELFYDGKEDRWNEVQGAFGVDFPWRYKTIVELECMAQFVDGQYSTLSFGIILQKHL